MQGPLALEILALEAFVDEHLEQCLVSDAFTVSDYAGFGEIGGRKAEGDLNAVGTSELCDKGGADARIGDRQDWPTTWLRLVRW